MIKSISGDIMSPIKHLPSGDKERLAVWLPTATAALIRTYCANRMTHSKLVNDAVIAYIEGRSGNENSSGVTTQEAVGGESHTA